MANQRASIKEKVPLCAWRSTSIFWSNRRLVYIRKLIGNYLAKFYQKTNFIYILYNNRKIKKNKKRSKTDLKREANFEKRKKGKPKMKKDLTITRKVQSNIYNSE